MIPCWLFVFFSAIKTLCVVPETLTLNNTDWTTAAVFVSSLALPESNVAVAAKSGNKVD